MEIEIVGGGKIVITDEQIKYWSNLYEGIEVEEEIEIMENDNLFKTKTKNGVLKAIKRNLENKYNDEMPYVCNNCGKHFSMPNTIKTTYEMMYGVSSLFPNSHEVEMDVCPYCMMNDIEQKYY